MDARNPEVLRSWECRAILTHFLLCNAMRLMFKMDKSWCNRGPSAATPFPAYDVPEGRSLRWFAYARIVIVPWG